jgi:hypothetical protein
MKTITYILRSEAFAVFAAAAWIYSIVGASWWLFLALILVPDVFMAGYFKDSRLGALLYNAGHTYLAPALLLGVSLSFRLPALLPIAIIWIAHISMDRALGFGLKLDTGFKDTHLGRLG